MTSRREFLSQTVASAAVTATSFATASHGTGTPSNPSGMSNKGSRIKSAIRRDETVLRYGGNGDNWHMTWASDDRQYVGLCDGAGFSESPTANYNSRILAISGGPHDATFQDIPGYPMLGEPTQQPGETRYYGFGCIAIGSSIYQFLSAFNRALRRDEAERADLERLLRFNAVKLIYSPDSGRTWHNQNGSQPVGWEGWPERSKDTMLFLDESQGAFSILSVLQMGRGYSENRDGYVYIYSPNGIVEGTMNELVMFRAPKDRILERRAYEYFAGLSSEGVARWARGMDERAVVHTFPSGWVNQWVHPWAWVPSITYNAPLGVYLMANWATAPGPAPNLEWFSQPSYLGFWIAKNPWGPWTQIHEDKAWKPAGDRNSRAFATQISPKWIAPDGKSFWMVWSDYQQTLSKEELKRRQTEIKELPSAEQINNYAKLDRLNRPYYSFNAQRVDLTVA